MTLSPREPPNAETRERYQRREKFQGIRFAHLDFDTTICSKDVNKKRKINNGIGLEVLEQLLPRNFHYILHCRRWMKRLEVLFYSIAIL